MGASRLFEEIGREKVIKHVHAVIVELIHETMNLDKHDKTYWLYTI